MNFRQLEYIVALYEYKNMTRAAKALYVSQPTLSRFLSNYEAELGTRLFERKNEALLPTYICETIIGRIQRLLAEKRDLDREVAELTGKDRMDFINIGGTPSLSIVLFPRIAASMRKINEDIRIFLHEGSIDELVPMMQEGKIDVIFTHRYIDLPEIFVEKVHDEALLFIMSKKNPVARRAVRLEPDDRYQWLDMRWLKDTPFIGREEMHIYQQMKSDFLEGGFSPRILFSSRYIITTFQLLNSYEEAVTITDETQWLATAPSLRSQLQAFYIRKDRERRTRPLYALTRSEGYRSKALRATIQSVRELFGVHEPDRQGGSLV